MIRMRDIFHRLLSLPLHHTGGDFAQNPLGNEGASAGTKTLSHLATPPLRLYHIEWDQLLAAAPMGSASGELAQGDA